MPCSEILQITAYKESDKPMDVEELLIESDLIREFQIDNHDPATAIEAARPLPLWRRIWEISAVRKLFLLAVMAEKTLCIFRLER